MKKFFRINYILIRNAWIRDSKISGYIFSQILLQAFDMMASITFILVVYMVTPTVGGWNIYQTLFLFAFVQEIAALQSSWLKRGINSMTEELIRLGDYDFYLTKPYDTMTLVSISKPRMYTMAKALMYIGVMAYALGHLPVISLVNYLWFIVLFCAVFILFYAVKILTILPVFWTIKATSLSDVMDRMTNIMRYPATIYPRALMIFFSTAFPILIISYIPAKTLFYPPDMRYIVYTILISIFFLILSKLAWKIGESNYSSASS